MTTRDIVREIGQLPTDTNAGSAGSSAGSAGGKGFNTVGFTLPTRTAGAGAPEIEDGLQLARFDDLKIVKHPDWAGIDDYGHNDDGQRYHFQFTMLDKDDPNHPVLDDSSSEGDPLELEALTRLATGARSGFRKHLSKLLTPAELAAYDAATPEDQFKADFLPGRIVHVSVTHSKGGWPQIESVVGIFNPKAAK